MNSYALIYIMQLESITSEKFLDCVQLKHQAENIPLAPVTEFIVKPLCATNIPLDLLLLKPIHATALYPEILA